MRENANHAAGMPMIKIHATSLSAKEFISKSGWSDFFNAIPANLVMRSVSQISDNGTVNIKAARMASGRPPIRNAMTIHVSTSNEASTRGGVMRRSGAYSTASRLFILDYDWCSMACADFIRDSALISLKRMTPFTKGKKTKRKESQVKINPMTVKAMRADFAQPCL